MIEKFWPRCETWNTRKDSCTMDVEFRNLSFTVRQWKWAGSERKILKSVSGRFKPGELSAIMGPSGAGKSSLLNALSGYNSYGVTGTLLSNGKPRNSRRFHKLSCYITQEDLLQPMLTVQESMMVAASLKLPTRMSSKAMLSKVEEILTILGLSTAANTRTEHLSGGQKKRLSIALEMINNPPVFFLDEPTTGLDDVAANQTIKLLRTLAKQGRTIVCTIHQPSASSFQLFDHVYVVSQGMCVYQGSTKELVSFFTHIDMPCPIHYNPADYVIELTDGKDDNVEKMSNAIMNGEKVWKEDTSLESEGSKELPQLQAFLMDPLPKAIETGDSEEVYGSTVLCSKSPGRDYLDFPTSFWYQSYVLLKRMLLQTKRSKVPIYLQLIHHVICSVMLGGVYYQGANDAREMFMHFKFAICLIFFYTYTWCMTPVLIFPLEIKLMQRELFNRWYAITPYYIAATLAKLPMQVALSTMFMIVVYFLNGLPAEFYRLFCFVFVCVLISLTSEGMGLFIGSICSIRSGSAAGPCTMAPLLIFAFYGFDFAKELSWMTRTLLNMSFMRTGTVAIIIAMFGMDRKEIPCDDIYCHYSQPQTILNMMNIEDDIWRQIATLFGFLVFIRFLWYIALWWKTRA